MAKAFPNTGVTIIDSSSDLTGFSPSEGLMVFQKDTNELKIYDGAGWVSVIDTDNPPACQLMSPGSVTNGTNTNGYITFSGVSSVNINNVFTSAFPYYRIYISGLNPSINGVAVYMRLRNASGDIVGSAGTYQYGGGYTRVNGIQNAWANNSATLWDIGRASYNISRNDAVIDLSNPVATGVEKNARWTSWWDDAVALTGLWAVGGMLDGAQSVTGFSIFPSSGNLTGNIRVYGFRGAI